MDKKEIIEKLKEYKELISESFDLDRMYLFGSYSNGRASEFSDIDVAVIVNSIDEDFFTYSPRLWKLRRNIDERIEPVLFKKGQDESGFLSEIEKNGILI